jgi:hypothetical protein
MCAGLLSSNTWDVSVKLDALPSDVLRTRIVAGVEKGMDVKQVSRWKLRVGALDNSKAVPIDDFIAKFK